MFYTYRNMRLRECQFYPRRDLPVNPEDPIDLHQLAALRLSQDREDTACPFRLVGNDDHVDSWITFGHANELLTVEWQMQLDQFAQMPRGDATRKLFANDRTD